MTYLVTGTVRRAGTGLRVTADLVEANTDTPLWSEKFSGTMEDVFGIQALYHARQSVYASSGERQPRFRLTRTLTGQSSIADAMPL